MEDINAEAQKLFEEQKSLKDIIHQIDDYLQPVEKFDLNIMCSVLGMIDKSQCTNDVKLFVMRMVVKYAKATKEINDGTF